MYIVHFVTFVRGSRIFSGGWGLGLGGRDIFFQGTFSLIVYYLNLKNLNFQGWGGGLDPPTPTSPVDPRMHMVYIL